MQREKFSWKIDRTLLFMILFLLVFGLIMIYSVSSYEAFNSEKGSAKYLKKQLGADVIGVLVMMIAALVPYRIYNNKYIVRILYLFSAAALVMVKFFGIERNHAKRWLPVIPGLSLTWQPAELTKIAVIISLAYLTCKWSKGMSDWRRAMICIGLGAVQALMVFLLTKNLSSGLIVGGIAVVMTFIASGAYKMFLGFAALFAAGVGGLLYWVSHMTVTEDTDFRFIRILAWRNPEMFSQRTGFQTIQGLYAIGSGGFFGKGLGQSMQKLGFIPEAQNDMIFSIICEELGLFGAIAVMVLFVLLLWRMVNIANQTKDMFGAMLVVGVVAHISLQVVLNIAVVTNTIPNTGISLPFISYGGTSVLFLLAEMGIVLNVGHHTSVALDREVLQ